MTWTEKHPAVDVVTRLV